jgi:2-keto-4-pentenoate hydratase
MNREVEVMTALQKQALVDALSSARQTGALVPKPEFSFDLAQAYAIQMEVAARLDASQIGWKVGSTSEKAQARLGTSEPGAGPLLQSLCFASGANIAVHTVHQVQVEVEFAFRLSADLGPRRASYTAEEVAGAVGTFMPAFEFVGSRFVGGLAGGGREQVTADGGANVAFAYGDEMVLPPRLDLADHVCTLQINATTIATGQGSAALGHPYNVLAWLANFRSRNGAGLRSGEIVTTGTCTGLVDVAPGDEVIGDFGSLGQVRVTLSEAYN